MNKHTEIFLSKKFQTEGSVKPDNETVLQCRELIKEPDYFEFILSVGNGGFFYNQSLQLYTLSPDDDFRSIIAVNNVLTREYGALFNNLFSFGQDAFGNQFAFDMQNSHFVFFNIESGEQDKMGNGFKDWLSLLMADLEYYTGVTYINEWKEKNSIALNERLQPKIPFVIGGEYATSNFYTNSFPLYLSYNADIAKQIINLKDGEKVKLNIKNLG